MGMPFVHDVRAWSKPAVRLAMCAPSNRADHSDVPDELQAEIESQHAPHEPWRSRGGCLCYRSRAVPWLALCTPAKATRTQISHM